jgi:hypothetical protein
MKRESEKREKCKNHKAEEKREHKKKRRPVIDFTMF